MFYRRKLLLSLLQSLGRPVNKVDLQKYLFLVCAGQEKPSFEFIPHRFGCYSFQIDADKRTLTKYRLIEDCDDWRLSGEVSYLRLLTAADRERVEHVAETFGSTRGRKLIRHVYTEYPYYAINSEIRSDVLTDREQEMVKMSRPKAASARLFTIGYEGKTLERFLNQLIQHRIRVLCDVRRNPVSMKFGFSKNPLRKAVNAIGIDYIHIPELGISSAKRAHLATQGDYEALFEHYRRTTLAEGKDSLNEIVRLIRKYRRVALTCFEEGPQQCHRGCIADDLQLRADFPYRTAHL